MRKDSYPIIKDHGWAWVIAFTAHFCRILHDGIVNSFGVILPILSFQYDTKVWEIGFSVSLMVVVGSVLVVIAGPFISGIQPRYVLLCSGVSVYLGFIICAWVTSWGVFAFSLIVIIGIPLRVTWFIMLSIQGDYFDKHYVTANSIAYSGSSVAVIIFAPFTQFLLDSFGWRGTLLVLASITLNICTCGALVKLRTKKKSKHNYIDIDNQETNGEKSRIRTFVCDFILKVFEPALLKQPDFGGTLAAEFAFQYAWTGWMIYLVPYARSIGFSPYHSTTLSSVGGIGSIIGNVAIIFILQTSQNLVTVLMFLMLVAGFSLEVYSLSTSFAILLMASFTFGMTVNAGLVGILSMSKALEGELSQAVSWLFFASALGRLTAGFFTGWIHDMTSSYDISFVILGGVLLSAAIIFGVLLLMERNQKSDTAIQ